MGSIFLTSTGLSSKRVYDKFKELSDANNFRKAVVITTAASNKEKNQYSQLALSQLKSADFVSVDFYDFENEGAKDLSEYDVLYVCGGNTLKLMKFAKDANFNIEIKALLERGGAYIGVSAGSLILGPSIKIADEINPDENEVGLTNFNGFNVVDFVIFPHYEDKYEDDIKRFEDKYNQKVKRLRNDEFILVDKKIEGTAIDFNRYIKPLKDCSREEAGTKGYNLKIISDINGVNIPKTLCISAKVFNVIINPDLFEEDLSNFNLPLNFSETILDRISDYFGDGKLVIRSSATCEDSPFLSFAGNYSSFLNISGKKKILYAMKECYLSMFNKNSRLYGDLFGLNTANHSMAILIQEVAPVTMSGVMFTKNPIRNNDDVIIEYTNGLGDKVVGGTIIPKNKTVNLKDKKREPKFILDLISLGKKIENKFKKPQDIEWGMLKNKNFIFFQSRPITTLKKKRLIKHRRIFKIEKTGVIARGIGASIGVTSGMLLCIKNKNQLSNIKKDSILYFDKIIDLKFLQQLPNIKGIIISGGVLSHIAVIARELKIPFVANVYNLKINNKKMITMDGDSGLIYYDK